MVYSANLCRKKYDIFFGDEIRICLSKSLFHLSEHLACNKKIYQINKISIIKQTMDDIKNMVAWKHEYNRMVTKKLVVGPRLHIKMPVEKSYLVQIHGRTTFF